MDILFSTLDPALLSDPSTYAGPVYALFIFLEITLILILKRGGDYEPRDASTSILMGTGSVLFGFLLGGLGYALLFKVYTVRVMDIPTTPLMLAVLFVVYDFIYYWNHRWSHRIRWFWANHVVHHSSQHYNLSTALRQPWFSSLSGMVLVYTPFAFFGVHPGALAFVGSLNLLYQFFIHTESIGKFPRWIEAFMNTPSHHRVHHSTKPEHLDMNYAGVFIVWDRMMGTFIREEDGETMHYGIVHNLGTFNPLRISSHEFVGIFKDVVQRGLTLRQRLAYIFAVPGWTHDGSRQTSDDLKRESTAEHEAAHAQESVEA
ncbi:MAG: C-5 sterol desaturase [Robiginitomaculum sp.]|nr:MAG: C-5 sterol desaturase [Robiginitomaculum sp.]